MKVKAYFDGGNEKEIGAWAFIIKNEKGKAIHRGCGICIDDYEHTNNIAEWTALTALLNHLLTFYDKLDKIEVFGDSQLVIRQIKGEYACKKSHLIPYKKKCEEALKKIKNIHFSWIDRNQNNEADKLGRFARDKYVN